MILEENHLQTVQEWTKSYIELITLYAHTKNSNHLRSHLRDIMALDYSRLGHENKFLENKIRPNFFAFDKFTCQQIWGRVNQPFIPSYTSHLSWNSTWGAAFIIQTSDRMQYFTILQYKFHSWSIQDDGPWITEATSFPGFSPTRPSERERERPWKTLVTCLPESGRLQTNDLGEGQVSVRFVSTERRQVSAAIKLCTWPDLEHGK